MALQESQAAMALDWNLEGSRKPKITWLRTVLKEARQFGKTWAENKQLALNQVRS